MLERRKASKSQFPSYKYFFRHILGNSNTDLRDCPLFFRLRVYPFGGSGSTSLPPYYVVTLQIFDFLQSGLTQLYYIFPNQLDPDDFRDI